MTFHEWFRDWQIRTAPHMLETTQTQLKPFMYSAWKAGQEDMQQRIKLKRQRKPVEVFSFE